MVNVHAFVATEVFIYIIEKYKKNFSSLTRFVV